MAAFSAAASSSCVFFLASFCAARSRAATSMASRSALAFCAAAASSSALAGAPAPPAPPSAALASLASLAFLEAAALRSSSRFSSSSYCASSNLFRFLFSATCSRVGVRARDRLRDRLRDGIGIE